MGGVASRTARGRGSSLNFRKKAPSKTLESRSTSNPEHGHQTPSLAANTMADREGSIERQRIGSTNPDLPDGEMLHELFGMITSKTKKFVEAEEIHRHVPSKETNLARKSHRVETKDLRILMQKLSRESRSLGDLRKTAMEYGLMEGTVENMANHCSLPRISKLQDGRLVDQSVNRK